MMASGATTTSHRERQHLFLLIALTPGSTQQYKALCRTVTLNDIEDGILAKPQLMTDLPIGLTFGDEL
jgi:hypothetical protein